MNGFTKNDNNNKNDLNNNDNFCEINDSIMLLSENYIKRIFNNIFEFIENDTKLINDNKQNDIDKLANNKNQNHEKKLIENKKLYKTLKHFRNKNNSFDKNYYLNYSQENIYHYPLKINSTEKMKKKGNSLKKDDNEKDYKRQNLKLKNQIQESMKLNKNLEKEKQFYKEKFQMLKNRVSTLKKQETNLKVKIIREKQVEKNLLKIKKNKEELKQQLLSIDIDKRIELEKKKIRIKNENKNLKKRIEQSKQLIIEKKINEYNKIKNESNILNFTITKNKLFHNIKQNEKIKNIQSKRGKFKIEEQKKQLSNRRNINEYYKRKIENDKIETQFLKTQCEELEKLEEKYIKLLIETQNKEKIFFNKIYKNSFLNRARSGKNIRNNINHNSFIENNKIHKNQNLSMNKTIKYK